MNAIETLLRQSDREGLPQQIVIDISEDGMVRAYLTERLISKKLDVSLDSMGAMHMIAEADNINEALVQLNQIELEAQQRAMDSGGTS